MIGLYDQDGLRLPIEYRGLTLNDPTDDDPSDTYEVWAALIDSEHAAVAEAKQQRDGSEIYRPRKQRRIIRITGAVKAPTSGELFDKIEELMSVFDPVNAYEADDSDEDKGFLPLEFSRPTADLANYATGVKELQYYARPIAQPITRLSKNDGKAAKFAVLMECADPRAYARTASSANRTNAGAITVDNLLASYSSWPTLEIDLSGATGVVNFQRVSDHDTRTLRLDFTGLTASDTVTVDMERRLVQTNGVDSMDLVVPTFGDYWWIAGEDSQTVNAINVSGTALAGLVTVEWLKAFA